MNFLGLVLFIGLIVAVEITSFSLARTTHDKVQTCEDDDDLGVINATIHAKHKGKHAEHRSKFPKKPEKLVTKCLEMFALGTRPPLFPPNLLINTRAICQGSQQNQDAQYGTLYDDHRGIPLYSIYRLLPQRVNLIGSFPRPNNPMWFQTPGFLNQGSNALYGMQPTPRLIHRGHLAPFELLSHGATSGLASFSYTNAVPQYRTFNCGQWRVYEGRIRQFAEDNCAAIGGSLYLITGTSEACLLGQGGPVQRQPMDTFPNKPDIQTHLSIPNSMWTVGCCVRAGEVLRAFAVIGNNVPVAGQVFMSNPSVTQVEQFIRDGADDQTIQLFPGSPDCYAAGKQFYF